MPALPNFVSILNSQFTTALLGALAGAYAGAYAAQRSASRAKLKDEALDEIRRANSAVSLAAAACSTALSLKGQHVLTMLEKYRSEHSRFSNWKQRRALGLNQGNTPYEFSLDLQSLPRINAPTSALEQICYEKLSLTGRAIGLCAALSSAVTRLNESIAKREELIERFKAKEFPDGADPGDIYLGEPFGDGHVSREYPDVLHAIESYVDDCIFYSTQLGAEVTRHGRKIARKHTKLFGKDRPSIVEVKFSDEKSMSLMPSPERYTTWLQAE